MITLNQIACQSTTSWLYTAAQQDISYGKADSDRTVTPMLNLYRVEQHTCVGVDEGCTIDCWHYLADGRAVVKSGLQCTVRVLHCMDLHHHIIQLGLTSSDWQPRHYVKERSARNRRKCSWRRQSAILTIIGLHQMSMLQHNMQHSCKPSWPWSLPYVS